MKFVREPFYRTTPVDCFWDFAKFLSYLPFFFRNNYFWGTHPSVCFERMLNVYAEVLSYKWEKLIEKLKYWNFFPTYLWDPYQSVVKLSILLLYIIVYCRNSKTALYYSFITLWNNLNYSNGFFSQLSLHYQ